MIYYKGVPKPRIDLKEKNITCKPTGGKKISIVFSNHWVGVGRENSKKFLYLFQSRQAKPTEQTVVENGNGVRGKLTSAIFV